MTSSKHLYKVVSPTKLNEWIHTPAAYQNTQIQLLSYDGYFYISIFKSCVTDIIPSPSPSPSPSPFRFFFVVVYICRVVNVKHNHSYHPYSRVVHCLNCAVNSEILARLAPSDHQLPSLVDENQLCGWNPEDSECLRHACAGDCFREDPDSTHDKVGSDRILYCYFYHAILEVWERKCHFYLK